VAVRTDPTGRTLVSDKELGQPRARLVYWIVLTLTTVLFTLAFVFPGVIYVVGRWILHGFRSA